MVADDLRREPSLPSPTEIQFAENLLRELTFFCKDDSDINVTFHNKSKSVKVPFSRKMLFYLVQILEQISMGNDVEIFPIDAELTTREAADLLNVSRQYLVKLLKENRIPFHKVGTQRRIKFEDLMKYKAKMQVESEQAMDELTRLGQELKLKE